MRVRQLAACVLGATMFWQSSALAFASEKEIPVLTLEKAIEYAKNTSLDLKIHELNYEVSKANSKVAKYDGYYAALTPRMNEEYMRKNTTVLENKLTLEVMNLFDEIILEEETLALDRRNQKITEKDIQKAHIELSRGITSEVELQTLKLEFNQKEKEIQKAEENLAVLYDKLWTMMGTSLKGHVLDKGDSAYTPYRDVPSINLFATDKAEDHISLWKANEELNIAMEVPIMSQEYMTVVSKKADREIKDKEAELTEQNLEQAIKQVYLNVKQIETSYSNAKEDLELQEKQMKINDIYFEKGMMSTLEYEKSLLAYEQAQLNLMQLESQHMTLTYQLDHPYLISAAGY